MQANRSSIQRNQAAPGAWLWLGPLLAVLLIGVYFSARFGGRWAESDTAAFATYTSNIIREGRLVSVDSSAYPNGYAFQAISVYIVALTGLDVATLQQVVYPLLAALVVLPAWLTYRELTGSPRGAALATVLLFTQPEFLFMILRSSHEKFTRLLMLMCLFWLLRSFKLRNQLWQFALHVGLFYLTAFAFISSNNLLAHSFIFSIVLALMFGWRLQDRAPGAQPADTYPLKRLGYASLICLGLTYVFMIYIYSPAQHDLLVLKESWERVLSMLLDVQQKSTNAYAQVQSGWISLPIYFMVSIANWIVLAASFVIWARQGLRWLRGTAPASETDRLLWLFYAAFVCQGALSVVADASRVLGGNLQHRLFPSFAIFAVAVVGQALAEWRPRRFERPIRLGLTATIACVAILSTFKATNEPLLSNKWTFYSAGESAAMTWSDAHLSDNEIWTEFDERLSTARRIQAGSAYDNNYFVGTNGELPFKSYIISAITRLRAQRLSLALPTPADAEQVYDNGEAQFYHRRPLTPYQK